MVVWEFGNRFKSHLFLRWGWVFLEQTRILSGIQLTTNFFEIFVVETKRFVGSFVHMILTRQTCGQCSSRAAESKHRAIGHYFSERFCYMFLAFLSASAQWQNPIFLTSKHVFPPDFAIALRFSKRKYRSCAQT